jgi:hypothetical protein
VPVPDPAGLAGVPGALALRQAAVIASRALTTRLPRRTVLRYLMAPPSEIELTGSIPM